MLGDVLGTDVTIQDVVRDPDVTHNDLVAAEKRRRRLPWIAAGLVVLGLLAWRD